MVQETSAWTGAGANGPRGCHCADAAASCASECVAGCAGGGVAAAGLAPLCHSEGGCGMFGCSAMAAAVAAAADVVEGEEGTVAQ